MKGPNADGTIIGSTPDSILVGDHAVDYICVTLPSSVDSQTLFITIYRSENHLEIEKKNKWKYIFIQKKNWTFGSDAYGSWKLEEGTNKLCKFVFLF